MSGMSNKDSIISCQIAKVICETLTMIGQGVIVGKENGKLCYHLVSITCDQMIINHSCRLHEGITDRRSYKFKAASDKVSAHCIGFF